MRYRLSIVLTLTIILVALPGCSGLISDLEYVTGTGTVSGTGLGGSLDVECPSGKVPIAGGGHLANATTRAAMNVSTPVPLGSSNPTGWRAGFREIDEDIATDWLFEVVVVCVTIQS